MTSNAFSAERVSLPEARSRSINCVGPPGAARPRRLDCCCSCIARRAWSSLAPSVPKHHLSLPRTGIQTRSANYRRQRLSSRGWRTDRSRIPRSRIPRSRIPYPRSVVRVVLPLLQHPQYQRVRCLPGRVRSFGHV